MFSGNRYFKNFCRRYKLNFLAFKMAFVALLFILLLIVPASAQNQDFSLDRLSILPTNKTQVESKAAIAIDDLTIFQVSGSPQLSAQERAKEINAKLQVAIQSSNSPKVEIKQQNESPVIYLNDGYLLTVTSSDAVNNNNTEQQAQIWQTKLKKAIKEAQAARNPQYFPEKLTLAAIVLVVVFVIDRVLSLLKQYSLKKAIAKLLPGNNPTPLESPNFEPLFKAKLIVARVILWLATVYWLTGLFLQSLLWRNKIINLLGSSFQTSLFILGDRSYSLIDLLILGSLLWGLFIATQTLTTLLRTRVLDRTRMSRGSQEVIFVIVKYGLISFGTIILLQVWGLNLSSLTILGSALGVGIGFGFQDIAKNFASGLVLLFERSVQVGDFIEVNGHRGTVERIQARSIVLKTLDKVSIVVPNSSLLAEEVINWSHDSPVSRFALPVGVAYGSDCESVKGALLQIAEEHPEVLDYPLPQVLFKGLGDSSIDFELLVWIGNPSRQPVVQSELYFRLERVLRDRNIEIPFPQRDLHLRGNLPLGISPDLETALLRWLNQSNKKN